MFEILKGSDIVVKMLLEYGVDVIFGVPGDTIMSLNSSLYKYRHQIKYIRCRDERSAGFMADAYARITGRPGVCFGPSGGGVTYLLPGIAESQGSSIPLIALTGDISLQSDDTNALTTIDGYLLFKAVTKWNRRMVKITKIPHSLRYAFRQAVSANPGAVHLSLPEDILSGSIDENEDWREIYSEKDIRSVPSDRILPESKIIGKIVDFLLSAERPLILAGGGLHTSQAYEALSTLVERYSIPVVTSINGKGAFSEVDSLGLGVIGNNGGHPTANQIAEECDALLVLGSRLNSTTTNSFSFFKESRICQVDIVRTQIGVNYPIELSVVGDLRKVLEELLGYLDESPYSVKKSWLERVKKIQQENRISSVRTTVNEKGVDPSFIIDTLNSLLPEDSIIAVDAGTPTPYLIRRFLVKKASRIIISPRHHGALGYAIPAIVGAFFASKEKKLVSLFGDGSFGMSLGELETISYYDIPVILIHFNNCCYGWIKTLQMLYYDKEYYGVDFSKCVDPVKIAEGFGIKGVRIGTAADFHSQCKEAMETEKPVFFDIQVPSPVENISPVTRWLADMDKSPEERVRASY